MKRFLLLSLAGLLLPLWGCASSGADLSEMDEKEILGWAVERLGAAGSIEWEEFNYTKYQNEEGTVSISHSESKYIREPFTQWSRGVINSGSDRQFEMELFHEEKNYTITKSFRFSDFDAINAESSEDKKENADGTEAVPLTPWDTSSFTDITSDEKDAFIALCEVGFSQLSYLLSSNIDSFSPGEDVLDGVACIRYDGNITQETVLDYYEETGRDVFVQVKLLEKKEGMTREDLKAEILNAANTPPYEIASGLNEIVFADNPAPVSIWVDAASGTVMNIKIDLAEAAANHAKVIDSDVPIIIADQFTEYRSIVFDRLKTLKRPE